MFLHNNYFSVTCTNFLMSNTYKLNTHSSLLPFLLGAIRLVAKLKALSLPNLNKADSQTPVAGHIFAHWFSPSI